MSEQPATGEQPLPSGNPTRLLLLKVWRDAVSFGSTSVSLIVLMAIGAGLFVLFSQAHINLEASYRYFYDQGHFADATVLFNEAPESLVDQVKMIPGVLNAEGRVVDDNTIVLRDRARRRTSGRFVGIDPDERPSINDIYVIAGRYVSARGECVLEQQFATANDLGVGNLLEGNSTGRRHDFRIVGLATSSEYLYPVPSKEQPFADPKAFGVCWVDEAELRQWVGLENVITEVHALCRDGAEEHVLAVMESLVDRYGLRSSWLQEGQPSHNLLSMDLKGFQAMSVVFPFLFMFAAGLSLYSSLTRIVRLQTGVVGFLRASGFSSRTIGWHYVCQGGLITVAGAFPGAILGHFGSVGMVNMYANVLHLPMSVTDPRWPVIVTGLVASALVGTLSALLPALGAARTPPAIAMHGVSDDIRINSVMLWLAGVTKRVPVVLRIAVRGLLRRPSRTLFAVGGLTSGTSLLLTTLGLYASVMTALDEWIYDTLQYELDVTFMSPDGIGLAEATAPMPGVYTVNRTCMTTGRLISAHGRTTLTVAGYQSGQRLMLLNSQGGREPDLRPGELWITKQTAKTLRLAVGDPVRLEWAYSSRRRPIDTTMRIGGVLDITFGGFAYGEYKDIRRRLVDRVYPMSVYGVMIACDESISPALRRRFERDEQVGGVASIGDIKKEIATSLRITIVFVGVLLSFGAVLAGAVLHSVSSISILERMRELATLRSLGFSAHTTVLTAALEVYVMAALALAAGCPLGAWMLHAYMGMFETETMSFPASLPPWCYGAVVAMVFGLVALSLRSGAARLRTMDLAQATKARE